MPKRIVISGDLDEPIFRIVGEGVEIQARGISVRIVTGTTRQLILHIDGECRRRIIVRADVQVLTRSYLYPLVSAVSAVSPKDAQTRSATEKLLSCDKVAVKVAEALPCGCRCRAKTPEPR
jgi:hypothetical protein